MPGKEHNMSLKRNSTRTNATAVLCTQSSGGLVERFVCFAQCVIILSYLHRMAEIGMLYTCDDLGTRLLDISE